MINYIVIHHSVTPRDQALDKSLTSFDKTHEKNLHPEKNSLGYHIAYHYVIAGDGSKKQTRGIPDNLEVGYHASSLAINKESIGICLTGNFDIEEPTKEQIKTLTKLLWWIRKQSWCNPDVKIIGHRDVQGVTKTCPGENLYNLLPNLRTMSDPTPPEWAKEAWEKAKKQGIVSDNSLPNANLTKAEMIVILTRAGVIK